MIDADALMVQMYDGSYNCPGDCGCCDPDYNYKVDGQAAFGCSAVLHAPTVEAIPVSDIEKYKDKILEEMGNCGGNAASSCLKTIANACISLLVVLWRGDRIKEGIGYA